MRENFLNDFSFREPQLSKQVRGHGLKTTNPTQGVRFSSETVQPGQRGEFSVGDNGNRVCYPAIELNARRRIAQP